MTRWSLIRASAIIHHAALAQAVEWAIEADMAPGSSWDGDRDDPDQFVRFGKHSKVGLWQLLPIKPALQSAECGGRARN
jgi:hypothetical protein